jgi:hypothetical protein
MKENDGSSGNIPDCPKILLKETPKGRLWLHAATADCVGVKGGA